MDNWLVVILLLYKEGTRTRNASEHLVLKASGYFGSVRVFLSSATGNIYIYGGYHLHLLRVSFTSLNLPYPSYCGYCLHPGFADATAGIIYIPKTKPEASENVHIESGGNRTFHTQLRVSFTFYPQRTDFFLRVLFTSGKNSTKTTNHIYTIDKSRRK